MFPEGAIRRPEVSVTHGGKFKPGVARLAQMAGVPVMPAVVVDSGQFGRVSAWIPIRRIRYGIIFGEPLQMREDLDKAAALDALEAELKEAFVRLYQELMERMEPGKSGETG